MLNFTDVETDRDSSSAMDHGMPVSFIDIERWLGACRRQLWVVIALSTIFGFGGVIYALSLTPRYVASAFLLIDSRRIKAVESAYDANPDSYEAAASVIDSQVELMRSSKVAEIVIKKYDLLHAPSGVAPSSSPKSQGYLGLIKKFINDALGRTDIVEISRRYNEGPQAEMQRAVEAILGNLDVRRVARTMIVQLSYMSTDPAKASQMANAFSEAYLADQLESKYEATKRASQWLETRINELKGKALASDLLVQKYKSDNNLIGMSGKLVSEQQLAEYNTQLVLAGAETAKAEARYTRIRSIMQNHQTDALVSEVIGNTIIGQLRQKYLDVAKREAEITSKLGKDHLQAINLRGEMAEYDRQMFAELGRLAESYRSEVDIAKSKENSIKSSLTKLIQLNAGENKASVTLRELEREGEAYRNLHQTYLQRYQEALQQQSFPILEARILTNAAIPLAATYPKKSIIVGLFTVLGGLLGASIGIWREFKERGFRSEAQIKRETNLVPLGIIPQITSGQLASAKKMTLAHSGKQSLNGLFGFGKPSNEISNHPRPLPIATGMMSYVLDRPGSVLAETLLATKLAADVKLSNFSSKTIGILSILPKEGKSVTSKNIASLFATLNAKTLLIDADLRNPELTRRLAPSAEIGLLEAVIEKRPLDDVLMLEERSGLYFLPAVTKMRMSHTSELLISQGMKELLAQAERQFDYVLIDLPPIGPVIDAKAMTPLIDGFVVITEWRRTPRNMVRNLICDEADLNSKCLGMILNKVDLANIKLHEGHSSRFHYYGQYAKSYYTEC